MFLMKAFRIWYKEAGNPEKEVHIYINQARPRFCKSFFVTEKEIHANNPLIELCIKKDEILIVSYFKYDTILEKIEDKPKFTSILDSAYGAFEFFINDEGVSLIHHNMCIVKIDKTRHKVIIYVWEKANLEKLYPKANKEKENETTSLRND